MEQMEVGKAWGQGTEFPWKVGGGAEKFQQSEHRVGSLGNQPLSLGYSNVTSLI